MIGFDLPFFPPVGFRVRDATLDDVEQITQLWYDSFYQSHKFFAYATPDTPATRQWLNEVWVMGILAGPSILKTAVIEDTESNNKIVCFGRLHLPQPDGSQAIPLPEPPAEWDPELTDALWGGMVRNRADVMGLGDFVGVDSGYQTKGLAGCLLDWVCRQADATGLEVYIDATKAGLPIYKKHFGFKEAQVLVLPKRPDTYGTYEVIAMVRQPKRLSASL
ncbi:hypothetical protein HJFPF1_04578 [Paramyrothecium foliicola]|nr:hypothetical protein HJFPF1_04578 [Paramyrothecium foliicola]